MEILGELRVGLLYLPDGKVIKFVANGLNRAGLEGQNPFVDDHMWKQYEEVTSRVRYLKCKPGDIFLDIGACIGTWSVHAAIYGAKVYAFEVGKQHIDTLVLNSSLNNVTDRILVYRTALRSKQKIELVHDGWMHVCRKSEFSDGIPIKSTTLDQWMKRHKLSHVDYIKIDVEGMEPLVLEGAINTLKEFKPKLIIEIHDAEDPKIRPYVETFLKNLGYKHERVPGLNEYFYQ